jgi:predicted nicotinamide N-methyase
MAVRTRYQGPEAIERLQHGGKSVRLVRPAEPDRLLSDSHVLRLNRSDDYMPYWAYLWPGAYLLAEAVARRSWPSGVWSIELGCGLGLAGMTAIAAGLNVHFTDYDEAPLQFVTRSLTENCFPRDRWSLGTLDWRDPPPQRFPIILGADLLYEHRLIPLVTGVIDRLLEPGGVALVAGPCRVATEGLDECLVRHRLQAEASPVEATDVRGRPVRGTLHTIQRMPSG